VTSAATRSGKTLRINPSAAVTIAEVGAAQQGQFGGLSGDGNTAIVGGPLGNPRAGATWVYTRRFLPGQTSSEATGVSADGKVVVGRSWKTEDLTTSQAYRWSFRVMTRSGVPAPFFAAWMTFKALQ
jgi:probable HAF family extracellular repeat protein